MQDKKETWTQYLTGAIEQNRGVTLTIGQKDVLRQTIGQLIDSGNHSNNRYPTVEESCLIQDAVQTAIPYEESTK